MAATPRPRLPRTVVIVGLVSLLNDLASEMVVPLIPLLLATVLAAGPAALGLIEGAAEAVANLLKLWAGRHSDLYGRRRKPYVVAGYLLSNLVRPLIALAGSWFTVLVLRVTDRIGKGVRTAPRDALLADAIRDGEAGRAFGFTRALDHMGAMLGALVAAAVVYFANVSLEIVIAVSAIPGLVAVALFAFAVHESPAVPTASAAPPPLRWSALGERARRYLGVLTLFALGRLPETFLLLRGHELGMSVVELLLLWAALHVVKAALAEYGGKRSDRVGRAPLLLAGWTVYAVAALGLAFVTSVPALWLASFVLASYYGLTEGAERAWVRDVASAAERGTAYGWYHMLTGLAAIPAGVLLGGLWAAVGASAAFVTSAAIAGLACALLWRATR